MNYDEPVDESSSNHDFEDSLRKLQPRAPRVDVDAIAEMLVKRELTAASQPSNVRFPLLTFGGCCLASSIAGAVVVFVIMGGRVSRLKQELASLSTQGIAVDTDVRSDDAVSANDAETTTNGASTENGGPIVTPRAASTGNVPLVGAARANPLPRFFQDEFRDRVLAVGSHLEGVAYRKSQDDWSRTSIRTVHHNLESSDFTPDHPLPTTRASLLKDLLES